MGYYHTTPNKTKIFLGSAEVWIADKIVGEANPTFYPYGILSALAVTPKTTTVRPEAVNGRHDKYVTEESETVNFAMQELDPVGMKRAMGDLTTIEYVTGAPVTLVPGDPVFPAQDIAVGAPKGKFILFSQQNYAGGSLVVPSTISVVKDPDGTPATLTLNTDYVIGQNEFGQWGIIPTNAGAWDSTKTHQFIYTYTPKASTIIHQGGKTTIETKIVKLIHKEADGRQIVTTYWSAEFTEGGGLSYKKDGGAEIIDFNVTLEAVQDFTKDTGKQLKQTEFIEA